MIPRNNHNEPILEPLYDYQCEEPKKDPSISIVASMENTIKKVAYIKEQIEELYKIKEQIVKASTLNKEDIITLIVLIEKLNENNGLELLKNQLKKEDIDSIKIVQGSLPAINILTDRNYEGVEYPLKAVVDVYKNFDSLTGIINNLQQLLELWNIKTYIEKLSMNLGTIEEVYGVSNEMTEIVNNKTAILTIKDKMPELLKLSEKIESIEKIIDMEIKIDNILTDIDKINEVYNNLDVIKEVHQSIHNINTLAQNIDKINNKG